jgi:hypothetical protein
MIDDPKVDLNKFISTLGIDKVIKAKREKIDDADGLWSKMKEELGNTHAETIIPILKGD